MDAGINFMTGDIDNARFEDPNHDIFRPEEGSVLIDGGQIVPFNLMLLDISGNSRLQGNAIDLGPNESAFSRAIDTKENVISDRVYPNPGVKDGKSTIIFDNPDEGYVEFRLLDFTGKTVKIIGSEYFSKGKQYKIISNTDLQYGINFIQIVKRRHISLIKLSIAYE